MLAKHPLDLFLALSATLALGVSSTLGQGVDETPERLRDERVLPFALDCGPFLDYQQPINQGGGALASFLSDESRDREIDEATVSGQTIVPVPGDLIGGMRIWGISFHNFDRINCFDDDSVPWNVRLYQNAGTSPGAQVGSTVTVVPARSDTGIQIFFPNVTLQQFDFAFFPPIDNTAGTISWIGAQRQLGTPDCVFHWVNETTPAYDNASFWMGSLPLALHSDMPICLSFAPIAVELERFEIE